MGLFSSKTYYSVGTSATKLLENNNTGVTDSVLDAVRNGKDVTNAILLGALTGHSSKATRFYNYGRDFYIHGLPDGTGVNFAFNESSIYNVLLGLHTTMVNGQPVSEVIDIISSAVDFPIHDFFITQYLTLSIGWNQSTGEVYGHGISTSNPVYLADAEILTPTSSPQLKITYAYTYTTGQNTQYEETLTGYVTRYYNYYFTIYTSHIYYHVRYDHDSTSDYFVYDSTSGTYPTLDLDSSYSAQTPFLPIAVLRRNFVNANSDTNSSLYKTSKALVDTVGLSLDDIISVVMDPAGNPDASTIRDIFVLFGLGITENSQQSLEYFYEFFGSLFLDLNKYTESTYASYKNSNKSNSSFPVNILNITDSTFNTKIAYNYISSVELSGVIGAVGHFSSSIQLRSPYTFSVASNSGGNYDYFSIEESYLLINKQVTPTTYQRIIVHGLTHFTDVNGRGNVRQTLATAVQEAGAFYIPLSLQILNRMDKLDLEDVYYNSLKLVIYAQDSQRVSWYKRPGFLKLVQIVLIVVAIYTGQAQITGIVGASSFTAGALLALETIAYAYLIGVGVDAAVRLLGLENTFIISIILTAVALYQGKGSAALSYLPSAAELMQASSALLNGISRDVKEQLERVQEERKEQEKLYNDAYAEIEALESDLETSGIPTSTILGYSNNIAGGYNTPYTEYSRTIVANPGVLTLSMIESFVSDRLTLQLPFHNNGT
jgi:hypothetical protein